MRGVNLTAILQTATRLSSVGILIVLDTALEVGETQGIKIRLDIAPHHENQLLLN